MRAAVYVRVSTDRQEDSPERQRGQVYPELAGEGWKVTGEYLDRGERGWHADRSDFQRLLADARAGLFDVIAVDEASRLSRQGPYEFMATVAYPLREAGVAVYVVAERRLYRWGEDDLADALVSFISQYRANQESKTLSRRVATGFLQKMRRRCIQTGRPPYGYRRVRGADNHPALVPGEPARVAAVRLIFECYARRDMSLADVCRALEARGTLSPAGRAQWRPTTVNNILRDENYVGTYVFNRRRYGRFYRIKGEAGVEAADNAGKVMRKNARADWVVSPNAHPPLVSLELFREAQERLAANRRRTTPLKGRGDFLLTRLLRCPTCGGWMCGLRGGKRCPPGLVRYRCGRSVALGKCPLNIVKEDEVVRGVLGALRERFLSPAFLTKLRAMARELDAPPAQDQRAAALRGELAELETNVRRARRNLSLLEPDMVAEVVADVRRWEARRQEVLVELATAGPTNAQAVEETVAEIEAMLRDLEDALLDGDRDRLRAVLRRRIAWVELDVRVTEGKKRAYQLAGGRVVLTPGGALNELAGGPQLPFHLPNTLGNIGQVGGWSCCLGLLT